MNLAFDYNWWQVELVTLWVDTLIYVLVISIGAYITYARRHEHLRAPWRHILQRRLAMSSLIILLSFVVVGLSDSIHFKVPLEQRDDGSMLYSTEVYSLFDRLVLPLKENTEKTYSEPFAYQLYAKENIDQPDQVLFDQKIYCCCKKEYCNNRKKVVVSSLS